MIKDVEQLLQPDIAMSYFLQFSLRSSKKYANDAIQVKQMLDGRLRRKRNNET